MKTGWEYKKLGEIITPAKVCKNKSGEDLPILSITMRSGIVFQKDRFSKQIASVDTSTYKVVNNGQLVIAFPIDEGLIYTQDIVKKGIMSPAYNIWDVDYTNLDRRFLVMYLHSSFAMNYYKSKLKGTTQRRRALSKDDLLSMPLVVPPLPTQQSIVSELDSLSKIIADCKETLKDYDALEQSIFYDMFGDPVKNEKGWEVKKIEDIGSCCSGGTPSRSHPEYFEGDIIWYSAGELNDLYLGESIEKITESALNISSAKLCKAGSLFVGMYDTAAFKMGIATVDSCSNQACANVTLNDNNNVIWLYFTLLFMKEEALKNRHGARQKNLNLGYIKNFNIPVPPLPLQQQFASKIEAIENMKSETKKALQETETLFQARMDYWFNG